MTKPTIAALQARIGELTIDLANANEATAQARKHAQDEQVTAGKAVQENNTLRFHNETLKIDLARLGGMIAGWREVGLLPPTIVNGDIATDWKAPWK